MWKQFLLFITLVSCYWVAFGIPALSTGDDLAQMGIRELVQRRGVDGYPNGNHSHSGAPS
jgi:hypothetical protein